MQIKSVSLKKIYCLILTNHSEADQPGISFEGNDAEAETPVLQGSNLCNKMGSH